MKWNQHTKYLFVTGGVLSSLGKGLSSASIGCILSQLGINVQAMKLDPYLNVDPGTMSPYQHGEVFVTSDGGETDLDLGHYERFLNKELSKSSSITSGRIYNEVIQNERQGRYLGKTIQVIPHVTDEIKKHIFKLGHETNADLILVEIGGTIGDIESIPFIESVRQISYELPKDCTIFLHTVPVIEIKTTGEAKTKPLQHSTKELRNLGIVPDLLLVRSEKPLQKQIKQKIAATCYIEEKNIFSCVDLSNIYLLPEFLFKQDIHKQIAKILNLKFKKTSLKPEWTNFTKLIKAKKNKVVKIAIVGKYVELKDAYMSLYESLKIASYYQKVKLEIIWIDSSRKNQNKIIEELKEVDGLIVPGGFGFRGINGKLAAIKYARENNLPFLGICLGMQLACIEFAKNDLKLENPNSTEFDSKTKNNIIDIIIKDKVDIGGTLRLGNYECELKPGSLAAKLYKKNSVVRRHRHRYEFNNKYIEQFEKNNFIFSGYYKKDNLQEIIEIKNHPYFIACQYHPEFNSNPYKPEELFMGLIKAAAKNKVFKNK